MDLFFYITIIVALSLMYYAYDKKKSYEIRRLEVELEHKKVELEMKKIDQDQGRAQ
ncbi:hypothetical protein RYX56_16980 [Alkalihalophilus lindianensis]|uniref:Sporulation protein YhaL n=1 Tax=Alkalihalophilus lindianensis TaxID=1630542 RepID=A0ABU3XDV3_9BACI|nr:hypothetical protein [Alkalihalophilus lindianensis]MDV2686064.1 hypothetical protein [Alkalihalophilus lindianensis]